MELNLPEGVEEAVKSLREKQVPDRSSMADKPRFIRRSWNRPRLGIQLAAWWLRWGVDFSTNSKDSGLAHQSYSRDMDKILRIDSRIDIQCKRLDSLYLNLAVLTSFAAHGDRAEFETQLKFVNRHLSRISFKNAQEMTALCDALLKDAVNYIVPIRKGDDLNVYCERLEALEQSLKRLEWETVGFQEFISANSEKWSLVASKTSKEHRSELEQLCDAFTERVGRIYVRTLGVKQKAVDALRVRELMQFS